MCERVAAALRVSAIAWMAVCMTVWAQQRKPAPGPWKALPQDMVRTGGELPIYPAAMKSARITGTVVLRVQVSKHGDVTDVQAVSGPEALEKIALAAVRTWRFQPYLEEDTAEPIDVETALTVLFPLDGTKLRAKDLKAGMVIAEDEDPLPEGVYRVGGDVVAPRVIHSVEPELSEEARKKKFAGHVIVHLVVDKDGMPQSVHAVQAAGMGLDAKAIEAVKQYRFQPGTLHGEPVPVATSIEVDFQIF